MNRPTQTLLASCLLAALAVPAAAAPAAPAGAWTCPQCGKTVTGKFCPECGDPFDDGDLK